MVSDKLDFGADILSSKLPWFQFLDIVNSTPNGMQSAIDTESNDNTLLTSIAASAPTHSRGGPFAPPKQTTSIQKAIDEGDPFLSDVFGLTKNSTPSISSQLLANLKFSFPEPRHGELSRATKKVSTATGQSMSLIFFKLEIYLVSNNFLSQGEIDHFTMHVVENGHVSLLMSCLRIKCPTMEAVEERLVESSVRTGQIHLLRTLIASRSKKKLLSRRRTTDLLRHAFYPPWKEEGCDFLWHKVTKSGHREIIRFRLAEGADINAAMFKGRAVSSVLHQAISREDVELTSLLIQAGANVNVSLLGAHTTLASAIVGNSVELFRILIDAGALVDSCKVYGKPALEWSLDNVDNDLHLILCHASILTHQS
jgi:ankyrin repeat protein